MGGPLFKCNIVNNYYQLHSRVLYTIVPKNSLGQLLEILITNFIFSKTLVFLY